MDIQMTTLPEWIKPSECEIASRKASGFAVACNTDRSEMPILVNYGEGWESTPFQTADAAHDIRKAAQLVKDWIS